MGYTSGSMETSISNGCFIRFSWEREYNNPTNRTTTISWTVKGYWTDSAPDEGPETGTNNYNWVKITSYDGAYPGTVISGSGMFQFGGETFINGETLASGTLTLQHSSATVDARFNVSLSFREKSGSAVNSSDYMTVDKITTPASYTDCTAPTTVGIENGIKFIKPNGSFKLTWSGASGGTNNSITGYRVYWRASSNGAAPTTSTYSGVVDVSSTSTSGSYTINFSGNSQTRGYKVVCKVITKGSAGSSYYSSLSEAASVSINIVPTAPVIKISNVDYTNKTYKFKSTVGNNPTIEVVPSTTSPEVGQNAQVYYWNISAWPIDSTQTIGGVDYTYSNPPAFSIVTGGKLGIGTYYFWGKDDAGDWSDRAQLIIEKNIKPVITTVTGIPVLQQAYGWSANSWGNTKTCKGIAEDITPTINCTKTGTLTITLEFKYLSTYVNTNFPQEGYEEGILNTYKINKINTNYSIGKQNVCSLIGSVYPIITNAGYYAWRLKFVLNDGVEDSNAKYYPAPYTENSTNYIPYYAIAGACGFTNEEVTDGENSNKIYNHFSNQNLANTNNRFCKTFRLKIQKDDNISNYSIEVLAGATKYSNSFTRGEEGTYYNFDVTLNSALPSGANITVNVIQTNSNNTIKKISTCTVQSRLIPEKKQCQLQYYNGSWINVTKIEAFEENNLNQCVVFISNPFNGGTVTENYGINANELQIKITCNGVSHNLQKNDGITTISVSNSFLNIYIQSTEIFNFSTRKYNIVDYFGQYQANLEITGTNAFGEYFGTTSVSIILDFDKKPILEKDNEGNIKVQIAVSKDNNTWYLFNQSEDKVQEGLYYRFNLKYTAFSCPDVLTGIVQFSQKSGEWSEILNIEEVTIDAPSDLTRSGQSGIISIYSGKIREIKTTYEGNKIQFWNQITSKKLTSFKESKYSNCMAIIHTQPTYSLNTLEKSQDGTGLTYELDLTNAGFESNATNFSINGYFVDRQDKWYTDWIKSSGNISIGTTQETTSFAPGRAPTASLELGLKLITKRTQQTIGGKQLNENGETIDGTSAPSYTNSKTYYSNFIFVDIGAPTVAYRKNAIGINTTTIAEGQLLEVHAVQGKTQIKLQNTDSSYFLIDLSKGTIDYIS